MTRAGIAILSLLCVCGQAWGQTLKRVAAIDLPGPKGQRFDYLTIDNEDHYLLSAHLGPGILYVIDTRTNRLVKAIPGTTAMKNVLDQHVNRIESCSRRAGADETARPKSGELKFPTKAE